MVDKLKAIIRNATVTHSVCNSDGEIVRTYDTPLVEEELIEQFALYLIANNVTIKETENNK